MSNLTTQSISARPLWSFDPALDARFSQITYSKSPYARIEGGKEDFEKVLKVYQERSIPGYDLGMVEIVFNPDFKTLFETTIRVLSRRGNNAHFAPTWENEKDASMRKVVHQAFQEIANRYPSGNNYIKIIPMYHGTKKDAIDGILQVGYANLAKMDTGFFGKGLYFTSYPEYAFNVYGDGTVLFNWVAVFSAYPISPNDDFNGKNNNSGYDAHYALVKPKNPDNPSEKFFISIDENEQPKYDELVIFDAPQIFPQYILTFVPNALHSMTITSKQTAIPTSKRSTAPITAKSANSEINALVAEGEREKAKGSNGSALKIFDRILQIEPKHAFSLFRRGEILGLMGKYQLAVEDLTQAAGLSPQDPYIWAQLASMHLQLGDLDLGLVNANRALKIDPYLILALKIRGIVYLAKKYYKLAMKDYDCILKIQPDNDEILSLRGQCYQIKGRHQEALKDLKAASQYKSGVSFTMCRQGEILLALKEYDSAMQSFQQILQQEELSSSVDNILASSNAEETPKSPYYKLALAGIGVCHAKKKRFDQALKYLNRVLEIDANMTLALLNRGIVYLDKGDDSAALRDFSQALKNNPNNPVALLGRADVLQKKGLGDKCLHDRKKAIDLKRISRLVREGEDDFARQEYDLAFNAFSHVLLIDPTHLLAKINLGEICYLRKDYSQALSHLSEALRMDPHHPTALSISGEIYRLRGDFDKALGFLDQALRMDSTDTLALFARATIHFSRKNFKNALEDMDLCFKMQPHSEKWLNFRADIHRKLKNYELALKDLFQSLSLNSKSTRALLIRGEVYYLKGNYEHALKDFTHVTVLAPTNAEGYMGLGKVCEATGDALGAKSYFKRAHELDPNCA